jgi:signal transduction histidine kinase
VFATAFRQKGYVEGAALDITARKQAEEEIALYRNHLEELVRERTERLEEAQVELVRKERLAALGSLTATVAHEIRNPLGTVRSSVFSIIDSIARKETHRINRAAKLAERNIIRCDRIIEELLDFTRVKEIKLQPTRIDDRLVQVIEELALPEGIELSLDLNSGVEINVDQERLRRSLINIVNNAVDALSDDDSVGNRITVASGLTGDRLEIRVTDNGPGIQADELDKVFEPLFSTKGFGVGMGLSIVKKNMEQMKGGVAIESEVGVGTTVILWFPAP